VEAIINKQATVFVCGDETKMAKEVQTTFIQLFQHHAQMSYTDAVSYLHQLIKNKFFIQDIWSWCITLILVIKTSNIILVFIYQSLHNTKL